MEKINKASALISSPRLCKMLKQIAKTLVCLVLCLALVWGYSYKEPMTAHASAVVAVGAVIVGVTLAALGISLAGSVANGTAQAWQQSIWDNAPPDAKQFCSTGYGVVYVTPALLQYVGNQVRDSFSDWTALSAITNEIPGHTLDFVGNPLAPGKCYNFYSQLFGITNYKSDLGVNSSVTKKDISGLYILGGINNSIEKGQTKTKKEYTMRWGKKVTVEMLKFSSGGYWNISVSIDGTKYYIEDIQDWYYRLLFYNPQIQYQKYILVAYKSGSESGYAVMSPSYDQTGMWKELSTSGATIGESASYPIPGDKMNANGKSALNNGISSLEQAISAALNAKGKVTFAPDGKTTLYGLTNTGSDTQVDSNNRKQTQAQTTGLEATAADEAANDTTNKGHDTSLPKPDELPDISLPSNIFKKFPFSLPWDLYLAFSNLVAPPDPPKYTVKVLYVPSLHWDYDIVLDLKKFDKLATFSRWGFSLLFTIGLIMITRKLIGAGG